MNNLVQFAHGALVQADDHSVKVNKEDHADFFVEAEQLSNPLAQADDAEAKSESKADSKKPSDKK